MGDSDDEFERRRRDKFRGERSDYGVGGAGGRDRRDDSRRRDDWGDRGRDGWGGRERGNTRRDYGRDYGRPRERYSPVRHDMSPPMKRMRPEPWEERRYPYDASYGHYGNYPHDYPMPGPHGGGPGPAPGPGPGPGMGGPVGGGPGGGGGGRMDDMGPTQPPMMSFKAFMEQCDENINEEEALKKYSDYKLEFKRQQLNEFFINHKEEEWFKAKYHPEEFIKRKEEQIENLKRRVSVFCELEEMKRMENISVDADQSDQLLKLLDSVVIKLEGGSDFDLLVLDQPPEEEMKPLLPSLLPQNNDEKKPLVLNDDSDGEEKKEEKAEEENAELDPLKKAKKYLSQKPSSEGEEINPRKRKRSASGSSSSSDSEDEPSAPPGMEKKSEEEPLPPGMEKKDDENEATENGVVEIEDKEKETNDKEDEGTKEDKEEGAGEEDEDEIKKPRALHKTASIFLRNLAPTITKQEVESMCRRYSGFLRAAIADPQPERRWFRRGWVTFKRDVNIKDICWNLNNIRLRDCELGAIVNRDLSRRIRTVNGITSHKAVVRADIKLSAKIIQNLDSRWGLWVDKENGSEDQPLSISHSGNPVLRNITDYLIEEASAEEEELLGANSEANKQDSDEKSEGETIQRDLGLIKVLDRLLLYLRIVHSVDYYNHSEYPNEDEMPNRCGIMHARGIPPSSKITPQEIQDYCRSFENKIGSFLQPLTKLSDDEAKKLGLKDSTEEVEKFIQSNTQEVGKDKWQCPLCNKKFKAEEFVHKHILNKHGEKVKEVQKEVEYFNNYLRDPKRPQLPEYPGNKQGGGRKDDPRMDPYVASYPQQPPMYGYNYGNRYPAPGPYGGYGASSYPKDFYNRGPDPYMRDQYPRPRATYRSRSGDPRDIIGYQDLDAPEDIDVF
ncbi:Serrate RNA effector molecule-like protein [Armadillidium nasatum]|uniref:Serrate RNA effector molecule homolog n=1 Tax=Armadillidium nasatum TaxID=96803 RepID=A0A5N5SU47_9CRUS|nr:Serrate RNA effector molecule-like protein [Armadillidium nasatum]